MNLNFIVVGSTELAAKITNLEMADINSVVSLDAENLQQSISTSIVENEGSFLVILAFDPSPTTTEILKRFKNAGFFVLQIVPEGEEVIEGIQFPCTINRILLGITSLSPSFPLLLAGPKGNELIGVPEPTMSKDETILDTESTVELDEIIVPNSNRIYLEPVTDLWDEPEPEPEPEPEHWDEDISGIVDDLWNSDLPGSNDVWEPVQPVVVTETADQDNSPSLEADPWDDTPVETDDNSSTDDLWGVDVSEEQKIDPAQVEETISDTSNNLSEKSVSVDDDPWDVADNTPVSAIVDDDERKDDFWDDKPVADSESMSVPNDLEDDDPWEVENVSSWDNVQTIPVTKDNESNDDPWNTEFVPVAEDVQVVTTIDDNGEEDDLLGVAENTPVLTIIENAEDEEDDLWGNESVSNTEDMSASPNIVDEDSESNNNDDIWGGVEKDDSDWGEKQAVPLVDDDSEEEDDLWGSGDTDDNSDNEDEDDPWGVVDPPSAFQNTSNTTGGKLLSVIAPKGGVGKTTMSILLAGNLARLSGKKVCLVDGNTQQADSGYYTGRHDKTPSIMTLAKSKRKITRSLLADALVTDKNIPNLSFLYGTHKREEADPELITPDLYKLIIDELRTIYDFIVFDTQSVEQFSEAYTKVVLPLSDYFFVIVAPVGASVENTDKLLPEMVRPSYLGGAHINPKRIGILLNRTEDKVGYDASALTIKFEEWNVLGAFHEDQKWKKAGNAGSLLEIDDKETTYQFGEILANALKDESLRREPPVEKQSFLSRFKRK